MMPNAKERRCGGQSQKFVEYVWPLASDGPTTSRAEFQTRVFYVSEILFGTLFPAPSLSR